MAVDRAGAEVRERLAVHRRRVRPLEVAGRAASSLRFSYSTDPGLDRPAWFIDDLEIKAGDEVIYSSDFSSEDELTLFPGGCGRRA